MIENIAKYRESPYRKFQKATLHLIQENCNEPNEKALIGIFIISENVEPAMTLRHALSKFKEEKINRHDALLTLRTFYQYDLILFNDQKIVLSHSGQIVADRLKELAS